MSKSKHRTDDLERLKAFRLIDDDFMSACFDGNKECTEEVLHTILGIPDLKVESVVSERVVPNLLRREIRLDIYARDSSGKVYNIEIQRADRGAIAQRARYYSGMIDVVLLNQGDRFNLLPETYVIFITEHDVFHKGLGLYHFDRICRETGEPMDDGAHIIYVNNQYRDNTPLGRLMHDFACSDPKDIKNKVLAERVRYLKNEKKGVASMCKMMDEMREEAAKEAIFNERVKYAINLKKMGLSDEQIAQTYGISMSEASPIFEEVRQKLYLATSR